VETYLTQEVKQSELLTQETKWGLPTHWARWELITKEAMQRLFTLGAKCMKRGKDKWGLFTQGINA